MYPQVHMAPNLHLVKLARALPRPGLLRFSVLERLPSWGLFLFLIFHRIDAIPPLDIALVPRILEVIIEFVVLKRHVRKH